MAEVGDEDAALADQNIGSDDISTPPDQSVWLHEHIPGSTLHILEGAPHFANLEQPQAWTEVVAGFLAEQGAV